MGAKVSKTKAEKYSRELNGGDHVWETDPSETAVSSGDEAGDALQPVERPSLESLMRVAEQTNALLLAVSADPQFNKQDIFASPVPLGAVWNFLRRTYLLYILPTFPKEASGKVLELANPSVFKYPDDVTGVFTAEGYKTDPAYLATESNWPEWDMNQNKLFSAGIMRNIWISQVILQRDDRGAFAMGGSYDFQPVVVELARGMLGKEVVDHKEKMRAARMSAGLAG